MDRGNLMAAIHRYRAAIAQDPNFIEAHYNLGLAYQGAGMHDPAACCYRKVLDIKPDHFSALNNLGQLLAKTGDTLAAEAVYRRAIAIEPTFAEPYFNLGELAAMRKDWHAAVKNYRKAIQIKPEMVAAYNNLGNVFQKQANYKAAVKCYRQVVRLRPELAEGYYNLGSALQQLDRFDEAIDTLEHALSLNPGYKEALNNLALTCKNRGDLAPAIAYFSQALTLDPDFAEAHWNRSFTYLLTGDFLKGWDDFEWRFQQPNWASLYPFRLAQPRWDGSDRPGQRILVHDEQGLGDTFQFVRYLPRVKQRCGTVVFETRKSIIPLLEGFPGIDQLIERSSDGAPAAPFDSYVPLMSLPHVFQTTPATIPNEVPYLAADPEKAAAWHQRLKGNDLKVGIVWAGRPAHMNDCKRSCRLTQFGPLADLSHVRWYGLQKGPAASQADAWPGPGEFINLGAGFVDFTDTAAAIANLDLVISVDTSVAHLAGAMGKPVWVLLPYIPDWRWMMDREDSPWYPTMRLFRQSEPGGWKSVFERVNTILIKNMGRPLKPQHSENPATARRFFPR